MLTDAYFPLSSLLSRCQGDAGKPGSHTAGFEAWLRARGGPDGGSNGGVFDAEAAAARFGVVKESYQPVALEPQEIFEV